MANPVLQFLITARDEASEIIGRVGAGMRGISQAVSDALQPLRTFQGLLATAVGVGGLNELKDRADAYTRLTNSLKVATKSEEDYRTALDTVAGIAQRTFSDLETTASLYARVASNAQAMGLSQRQVANLTELISKGMQLGGASAAEYASATLQLTQAFGSGVLRGEEFNAVMESSPELMRQLAAGLGVPIGALRGLAEQGRLTASTVATALLSQQEAIDTAYAETTQTVEQALTNLSSRVTLFVGQVSESSGASSAAANSLNFFASNIDVVAAALGAGFVAALGRAAASMGAYVQTSIAARQAAQDQAIAAAAQERAAIASTQANVAAAQAALNRAIQEQNLAREITRLLTAELGVSATEADLAAARSRSAAAAQAATAATQRLSAAQTQLAGLQAGAAASTGLFARALGVLTGPVGLIILAVTAFAGLFSALSDNKKGLDELAASTDQYSDSLKALNADQLQARMLELNAAIQEQEQIVSGASIEVTRLTSGHLSLFDVLRDGRPIAQQLTEAQGALADEEAKLSALQENLRTTTDALVSGQQQQAVSTEKQAVLYAQQALAMDSAAKTLENLAKQQKAVAETEERRLQSQIALATAAGDYQRVETLGIELAQRHARAAQEQANTDQAASVAAQAKVAALESEYSAYSQLTPKQIEALQQAREDAQLKTAQATASRANADAKRAEADSVELLTTAERESVTTARAYTNATEALANAQLDGLRAEIALAEAKGDTAEVQRLTKELALAEADGAVRVARAKQAEQEMEYALAVAKRNQTAALVEKNQATKEDLALAELTVQKELAEAQAAGINTQAQEVLAQKLREVNTAKTGGTQRNTEATQENTQATNENSEAQKVNIKHTEGGAAAAKLMNDYLQAARKSTEELSEATRNLFDAELYKAAYNAGFEAYEGYRKAIVAYKDGVNAGKAALTTFQTELDNANTLIKQSELKILSATSAWQRMDAVIELAAGKAKKAFYEEAIAAENLTQNLERAMDSTAGFLQQTVDHAENAVKGLHLLDEQDLSRLRAAIDAANDKLREMQEETQSARDRLAEMNAELLEAQGLDAKAELLRQQLDYQQQLADIEAQRQDAELSGNRELLTILAKQQQVLEQINRTKIANIEADAEAERAQARTQREQQPTANNIVPINRTNGGGKTYNLNLVGVRGQTLSATTNTDPGAFLDALEAAQRVT